jgi:uncharacterized protein
MRIVIAGGSGFLGRALTQRLILDGHQIVVLSRNNGTAAAAGRPGALKYVDWQPDGATGPWATALDGADAVVNLAGAGMADKRWSAERKAVLRSSRILATRSLVRAVEASKARPATFVQGSAVGYYGASLDPTLHDESSPAGDDFLGRLAADWESEAQPVAALGCRLAVVRTGIALSVHGGALPEMILPFKFFAGGPMASGRQMISWIHIDDWVSLVVWLLNTPTASGPFNASAPHPATSRELARSIGRAMHRPSWFPVPGFVLKIVVGEMAEVALIPGQAVVPARALAAGFTFAHPELNEAVRSALGKSEGPPLRT